MPKITLTSTDMIAFQSVSEQMQRLMDKQQTVAKVWRSALQDTYGHPIPVNVRPAPTPDGKSVFYEWPDPVEAPEDPALKVLPPEAPDDEGTTDSAGEDREAGQPEDAAPLD